MKLLMIRILHCHLGILVLFSIPEILFESGIFWMNTSKQMWSTFSKWIIISYWFIDSNRFKFIIYILVWYFTCLRRTWFQDCFFVFLWGFWTIRFRRRQECSNGTQIHAYVQNYVENVSYLYSYLKQLMIIIKNTLNESINIRKNCNLGLKNSTVGLKC